jgi:hypothetical protein
MPDISAAYLTESIKCFRAYKKLGEGALAQLREDEWSRLIDPEANSVALVIKHMAGNMRSRWTDFLTSDGEKPDRNRDQEFIQHAAVGREQAMQWWEAGWNCVFAAMESLKPEDLDAKVYIRGQEHSVLQAINRQIAHYAYHVGQIVLLAKHYRGAEWKSLSIPKGQSDKVGVAAEKAWREKRGDKN